MSKMGVLCVSAAFLLFGTGAYAQSVNVNNNTSSAAQAGSTAIAVGGGNVSPNKIKTTVPAFAPGLVAAGVHSCAGSVSVGVGATGWGAGFGSTYEMRECNRRAYAAALLGMGHRGAALDLICLNKEVRSALNATGVACPSQSVAARAAAQPRTYQRTALFSSSDDAAPAAIPAAANRTKPAMRPAAPTRNRKYSAKALGLSSGELRARGCVLRSTQSGNAWHCPRPIM